jgi:hypothetical protein
MIACTVPTTREGANFAQAYLFREAGEDRVHEIFEAFSRSLIAAGWAN